MKSVQILSFFWSVFSRIQSKYWKIRTRKTPYLDTFHEVKASDLEFIRIWSSQQSFDDDLWLPSGFTVSWRSCLWTGFINGGCINGMISLFYYFASDFDECTEYPDLCNHGSCSNKFGSFMCECDEGFKQDATNQSCQGKTDMRIKLIKIRQIC